MTNPFATSSNEPREQFELLALPFMHALYNTARRLTHHSEDASDLVQETYLRAYRTFQNFVPGTNGKAWLFSILYSVFVNKYRKEQREPEAVPFEQLEEKFERALATSDWQPRLAGEIGPEVNQALSQLPEVFRIVVLLVDVEELTYEETAAILHCPLGTVRSRLFRARKLLFLELQSYAQQQGYARQAKI